MKTYDWIVVGGGITGTALSYELSQVGFSVLLLEQDRIAQNATRYSYGGIPYWSGTSISTQQLCAEGIVRQRQLPDELDANTEFRQLDLLLTIELDRDPKEIADLYHKCLIPLTSIDPATACELEPLLNPDSIAGALTVSHAHVNAQLLTQAYHAAFIRAGGESQNVRVEQISQGSVRSDRGETFSGQNIAVCAGGLSRSLLKRSGIDARIYFTHAEVIETAPTDLKLRTIVMPADMQRFQLESEASAVGVDRLWDAPSSELMPPSIDPGAIQFFDRTMRLGQFSRLLTDPYAKIDAKQSELEIRAKIGKLLPSLATLPGTWHHCLVAFSHDSLPSIGTLPESENLYLFSGFTSPMVFVPPLAKRFATSLVGTRDEIIPQFSPQRFA